MSVGHTPQTPTRTRISLEPIRGTGTSSTRKSFTPRYTTARMVLEVVADTLQSLSQRRWSKKEILRGKADE